jgi:hypothetical protein
MILPVHLLLRIFDLIKYPISLILTCKKWMNLILEPKREEERRKKLSIYIKKDNIIHVYIGKEVSMWSIDIFNPLLLHLIKRSNLITNVDYVYPKFDEYKPIIYLDFVYILRPMFTFSSSSLEKYIVEVDKAQFYFDPREQFPLSRIISDYVTIFYDRKLNLKKINYVQETRLFSIFLNKRRGKLYIFKIKDNHKIYQFANDKIISVFDGKPLRKRMFVKLKIPFLIKINGRINIQPSFIRSHYFKIRKEPLIFFL